MVCRSCGFENAASARFCQNCGAPLGGPLSSEGERRVVTILFADVVGSTAMAERVDPEDWTDIMNGAMRFMNAVVARYEGTVGRLMGDAILAIFGAPIAHEDDAERAVRAGLDIVAEAARYADGLRGFGLDFAVRVGINTGLSVLATVGDQTKAEYTAMGDPANVAARLQGLAAPGMVLIGPDTRALVRHTFKLRPRGAEVIKGRREPVATYEVLAIADAVGSGRGFEGVRTSMVGRQAELETLQARLAAAAEGRGGMVLLVGEAGLGKSRLIAELRETREGRAARWLTGRSVSYARSDPYHPWSEVVLDAIGASAGEAVADLRAKLARRSPSSSASYPFLEALLGIESDQAANAVADIDGNVLAVRIADAVMQQLSEAALSEPIVVVLEDLHWADAASVELALTLAKRLTRLPILLLGALRPDVKAPSRTLVERAERLLGALVVPLQALAPAAAVALMQGLVELEDLPEAVRQRILARADGNPFYLEEVLRSLIDGGYIVRQDGRWQLTADVGSVPIPDTLEALLGARIDGLPAAARQVAQTASVIGRHFRSGVLGSVLEDDLPAGTHLDLAPQLDTLSDEDVVWQTLAEPEPEYAFKHALTQEAAYERLLVRRRRELHRRVAGVLERLQPERLHELAPVLAYHHRLGEAWTSAARYATMAAMRARHLYAIPEALAHHESALEALEHEALDASDRERVGLFVDAVIAWVDTYIASRGHERPENSRRILDRLERAIDLARAAEDKRHLVQALVAIGNVHALRGFPGTGFPALAEAHDLALELGDDQLFLLPFWAATEKEIDNDPGGAAERLQQVIEMARRVHNRAIEAHALASRAVALARQGHSMLALELVAEALEVAGRTNSTIKGADVLMMASSTFLDIGWIDLALEYSSEGVDLALGVGGFECACSGLYLRGLGRMAASQPHMAVVDFERAIDVGTGTAYEAWLHNVRVARAAALTAPSAVDERLSAQIEGELANALAINDGFGAANSELMLAGSLLAMNRVEDAEPHVGRALEWYRARDMKPYIERGLRLLAHVYDAQQAQRDAELARAEAEEIRRSLRFDAEAAKRVTGRIARARKVIVARTAPPPPAPAGASEAWGVGARSEGADA